MLEKTLAVSGTSPTPSHTADDVPATSRPYTGSLWIKFMTYIHWYPPDQDDEEKRLILKLDLSILIFGCLSFFTKYLDQQSVTNAYVRYVSQNEHYKS
jgi:ACS family pantothenate transporter-like MFS transporter